MFIVFPYVMRHSHSVQINLLRLIVLFFYLLLSLTRFSPSTTYVLLDLDLDYIDTETYRKELDKQVDFSANTGEAFADVLFHRIIDVLSVYVLNLAEKQIKLTFEQSQKEVATSAKELKKVSRPPDETASQSALTGLARYQANFPPS